jgi:hypothetical protein
MPDWLSSHPILSRWSLPIEFEQALQYANAALPADAYLFVLPDDDAAIPKRFNRKSFLQLWLKEAYTVLSHLGALRLPDHSILFPATPESAEEIPFDPIWLTTASLIGATNILAAPVSVLRTSSFLTTCHRQARARPCSPGAFYPDIDATFFRSPTVLKALQPGNFAGGRELPTNQWQTALTPYHFIVSIPGQKAPSEGNGFADLLRHHRWAHLSPTWDGSSIGSSAIRDYTPICQLTALHSCSARPSRAYSCRYATSSHSPNSQMRGMPSAQQTQPKGFGTRPPSSITLAT